MSYCDKYGIEFKIAVIGYFLLPFLVYGSITTCINYYNSTFRQFIICPIVINTV